MDNLCLSKAELEEKILTYFRIPENVHPASCRDFVLSVLECHCEDYEVFTKNTKQALFLKILAPILSFQSTLKDRDEVNLVVSVINLIEKTMQEEMANGL